MYFAPCPSVGGKRFSYLSRYLSQSCAEYHVLARRERSPVADSTAFTGNVHRVGMFPYFSTGEKRHGIRRVLRRTWKRRLCLVDPYIGWVIPAIVKGIRLHKIVRFNIIVVTVPCFSPLIAAVVLAKLTHSKLIIDYRDPWTNHRSDYPKPLGKWICPAIERMAIERAHTIVFCSDIMRDQFVRAFSSIAPPRLEVIYNGFEDFEAGSFEAEVGHSATKMLYAGNFYGTRRLSVIAAVLAELLTKGEISAETFQFHLYTALNSADRSLIRELRIDSLIHVHSQVPYQEIKRLMVLSDILFLPSGDDVAYAVPFKFFDYLSARRPILAVAPKGSSVYRLMQSVDCGEFAEFGETAAILEAVRSLIRKNKSYTFNGSEQFLWKNVASTYMTVIDRLAEVAT
jgi:hypothetical protein